MAKLLIALIIATLFTRFIQGPVAAAACFETCFGICLGTMICSWEYVPCMVACVSACTATGAIPGICFDDQTIITRITNSNQQEVIKIIDVNVGDILMTTNWRTKELGTTKVTSKKRIQEEIHFVKIIFSYDELMNLFGSIEVTKNHIMLVMDNGVAITKQAVNMNVGDKVLTTKGIGTIKESSSSIKQTRVYLSTEDETIIANDVLTFSDCSG